MLYLPTPGDYWWNGRDGSCWGMLPRLEQLNQIGLSGYVLTPCIFACGTIRRIDRFRAVVPQSRATIAEAIVFILYRTALPNSKTAETSHSRRTV